MFPTLLVAIAALIAWIAAAVVGQVTAAAVHLLLALSALAFVRYWALTR